MAKKEVAITSLEKAKKLLDKLQPKAPETKPLETALEELKPLIKSSFEKGYSVNEIAGLLEEQGIKIKLSDIKKLAI